MAEMDQASYRADQSPLSTAQYQHGISFQLLLSRQRMAKTKDAFVSRDQVDSRLYAALLDCIVQDSGNLILGHSRTHRTDYLIHGLSTKRAELSESITLF